MPKTELRWRTLTLFDPFFYSKFQKLSLFSFKDWRKVRNKNMMHPMVIDNITFVAALTELALIELTSNIRLYSHPK